MSSLLICINQAHFLMKAAKTGTQWTVLWVVTEPMIEGSQAPFRLFGCPIHTVGTTGTAQHSTSARLGLKG